MKKNKQNNIVSATIEELEKLNFRAAKPKFLKNGICEPPAPGSFLCLNNKDQNLWCELSAGDIKNSKVNCEKFVIWEKK